MRNYLAWKWHNLQNRREFYFFKFNLFLAFVWLSIAYQVNNNSYSFQTSSPHPYALTCILFFVFHLLYSISSKFPSWIRKIISEKPKMAYFTYLSFILSSWILVFIHASILDTDSSASLMVMFVLTIEMGISIIHHMGMANPFIVIVKVLSLIIWIIFLAITKMPFPVVIVALLSFIVTHSTGVIVEQELTRTFSRLDIDETSDKLNISNEFAKDFIRAFIEIDSILLKQLYEIGLPIEGKAADGKLPLVSSTSVSTLGNSPAKSSSFRAQVGTLNNIQPPPPIRMFRFNAMMTQTIETKYLQNALYHNIAAFTAGEKQNYEKFFINKMARFVFALLETSAQRALPLFLENHPKELMIGAPLEIFQLIIYLLVYDFVKRKKSGICVVTWENNAENWELHLKMTLPYVLPENNPPAPSLSTHDAEQNNPEEAQIDPTTTAAIPPTLFVPNLLSEQNIIEDTTSMERLAHRIFYKYFGKRIEKSTMEIKEGTSLYRWIVPLSRCSFPVTDKMIPAPTIIDPDAAPPNIPANHLFNSFLYDQLSETQWFVLGSKLQETGLLPYMKERLQSIHLPVTLVAMEDFKSILIKYKMYSTATIQSSGPSLQTERLSFTGGAQKSPSQPPLSQQKPILKNIFVIIPESHLQKFDISVDLPIIRDFCREIIIITDVSALTPSTLSTINTRYDITASYLLKPKSSLSELLTMVSEIGVKVEPRAIVNDEFLLPLFMSDRQMHSLANAKANANTNANSSNPMNTNCNLANGTTSTSSQLVAKEPKKAQSKNRSSPAKERSQSKKNEIQSQWANIITKLQSHLHAEKILTPAMSKIAEGRLKLLTDPSVLTNESNSFNHALLQSYLKKRKLAIALTLPLKQKIEFLTSFFSGYVTVMKRQWRSSSNLQCMMAILQDMEKKAKQFHLFLLTVSCEAMRDLISLIQQALAAMEGNEVITVTHTENDDGIRPFHHNEDEELVPTNTNDETCLYELRDFDEGEEEEDYNQAEQKSPLDSTRELLRTPSSRFEQYFFNVQNQIQTPLQTSRTRSATKRPLTGKKEDLPYDDNVENNENIMKILKQYQLKSNTVNARAITPIIFRCLEDGFHLLHVAIWESAFEE